MARKKKLTNSQVAAVVRKRVDAICRKFSVKFKIGEFVKEKYVKDNVGLVLQEVEAYKIYKNYSLGDAIPSITNHAAIPADYLANRYYNFKIKVLWLHHPSVVEGELDQICDVNVHCLTEYKEKKKKKVLESPQDL